MVNGLREVDFSHPTGHYTWKKFGPPLRKSWVRPWTAGLCLVTGAVVTKLQMHFLLARINCIIARDPRLFLRMI